METRKTLMTRRAREFLTKQLGFEEGQIKHNVHFISAKKACEDQGKYKESFETFANQLQLALPGATTLVTTHSTFVEGILDINNLLDIYKNDLTNKEEEDCRKLEEGKFILECRNELQSSISVYTNNLCKSINRTLRQQKIGKENKPEDLLNKLDKEIADRIKVLNTDVSKKLMTFGQNLVGGALAVIRAESGCIAMEKTLAELFFPCLSLESFQKCQDRSFDAYNLVLSVEKEAKEQHSKEQKRLSEEKQALQGAVIKEKKRIEDEKTERDKRIDYLTGIWTKQLMKKDDQPPENRKGEVSKDNGSHQSCENKNTLDSKWMDLRKNVLHMYDFCLQTLTQNCLPHVEDEYKEEKEFICRKIADVEKNILNVKKGENRITFTGDVSAGKSTFLNALLGADVSPIEKGHTTSAIMKIKGHRGECKITCQGNLLWSDNQVANLLKKLSKIMEEEVESEERNRQKKKENTKEYTVFLPFDGFPLLKNGITLVDSPGLGYTAAKDEEVMKEGSYADIVVLLVDSDQEIQENTIKEVKEMIKGLASPKVFICYNKWDEFVEEIVDEDRLKKKRERMKQRAVNFLIDDLGLSGTNLSECVYFISAKKAKEKEKHGDKNNNYREDFNKLKKTLQEAQPDAKKFMEGHTNYVISTAKNITAKLRSVESKVTEKEQKYLRELADPEKFAKYDRSLHADIQQCAKNLCQQIYDDIGYDLVMNTDTPEVAVEKMDYIIEKEIENFKQTVDEMLRCYQTSIFDAAKEKSENWVTADEIKYVGCSSQCVEVDFFRRQPERRFDDYNFALIDEKGAKSNYDERKRGLEKQQEKWKGEVKSKESTLQETEKRRKAEENNKNSSLWWSRVTSGLALVGTGVAVAGAAAIAVPILAPGIVTAVTAAASTSGTAGVLSAILTAPSSVLGGIVAGGGIATGGNVYLTTKYGSEMQEKEKAIKRLEDEMKEKKEELEKEIGKLKNAENGLKNLVPPNFTNKKHDALARDFVNIRKSIPGLAESLASHIQQNLKNYTENIRDNVITTAKEQVSSRAAEGKAYIKKALEKLQQIISATNHLLECDAEFKRRLKVEEGFHTKLEQEVRHLDTTAVSAWELF